MIAQLRHWFARLMRANRIKCASCPHRSPYRLTRDEIPIYDSPCNCLQRVWGKWA